MFEITVLNVHNLKWDKCYFKTKPYSIGEQIMMNSEDSLMRCWCTNYSRFAKFRCDAECCDEGHDNTCIKQYEKLTSPKCSFTEICSNIHTYMNAFI